MENNFTQNKWVFMGTPQIAVDFLAELQNKYGVVPDLIITNPDKPVGRKGTLTSPPVKIYADSNTIDCIQTSKLDDCLDQITGYDLFCVFAFGSLLKQHHLDLPTYGVVNIHPSLLPELRGPSPITSAILQDIKETGVTLIQLELAMDSGPIIAQKPVTIDKWEKWYVHEKQMAHIGVDLFVSHVDNYISKKLIPEEQNHEQATYCTKYNKSDMEINLQSDQYTQYRAYCAFEKPWFFNKKRYIIADATYDAVTDKFAILRVVPEGKTERSFLEQDIQE